MEPAAKKCKRASDQPSAFELIMGTQDDEESEQFAGSAVALDKEVSSYLNEAPVSWLVECLEWWKANSS